MRRENSNTNAPLLARRNVHQANDARVRLSPRNGEFAEVLIQRHKDPAFPVCDGKNLFIARILRPCAGMNYIVVGRREIPRRTAPDAGVKKDLHADSSNGSIRSLARTRRA